MVQLTKANQPFNWTSQCEQSFKKLKELYCLPPVLRYPDYNKEFILTTDASNVGLGAVLSQEGHPVCYISRTLNSHRQSFGLKTCRIVHALDMLCSHANYVSFKHWLQHDSS